MPAGWKQEPEGVKGGVDQAAGGPVCVAGAEWVRARRGFEYGGGEDAQGSYTRAGLRLERVPVTHTLISWRSTSPDALTLGGLLSDLPLLYSNLRLTSTNAVEIAL